MTPERTPAGKWVIYEAATGRRLERWPVDAGPMLASGECIAIAPENAEPAPAPVPTIAPSAPLPGVPIKATREASPGAPTPEPVRSRGGRAAR